jgi:membrane-bound lytic murein transglycosylase D
MTPFRSFPSLSHFATGNSAKLAIVFSASLVLAACEQNGVVPANANGQTAAVTPAKQLPEQPASEQPTKAIQQVAKANQATTGSEVISYQAEQHNQDASKDHWSELDSTDSNNTAAQLLAKAYAQEPNSQQPEAEVSTPVATTDPKLALAVNTLLDQPTANVFVEPEPAPILDLWQITVQNYGLTDHYHSRVDAHDKWYRKHTEYMQRVTNRSSRYYHYVLNKVLAAGLPAEIALLPIVESGFDTFAYSHGRAAGAWQFIPSTGRMFGLKQTWWYDGRRDVIASTEAAIAYLQQLNGMFDGDWLLAIAAYNGGPGTVSKAIKANKKRGKPTDYWSLSLPKETMHYVPKLLGLSQVVADHAGTDKLTTVANEAYFEVIDTGSQIDLAQAAELASVSVDEIYRLNPGYNQWATDPEGPHRLLVPISQAELFRSNLEQLPANKRIAWQRYIIQPGDSLLKLSKQYQVSVEMIRTLNNLEGNVIVAGKPLMIPVASKDASAYSLSAAQRVIKRQQQLTRTNAANRVVHEVASGDSLWTISKKYKVTVKQIASWNKIGTRSILQIGQKLDIWPRVATTKLTSGSRSVVKKLTYKVRSGDNLSTIAYRFNVTVKDIQRWNTDLKKYLQPGQKLTLFVDVTKSRS